MTITTDAAVTLGSKRWRMENLYFIRDKNKRLTKFALNGVQQAIWRGLEPNLDPLGNILKPIRTFNLKARQLGCSSFWLLFWLDETIFTPNSITGILADKRENLGYLFEIVRLAHAEMPTELRPKLGEDSKSVLSFPDLRSKIMVSLSIKSTALHNLHVSEVCYCEDDEISRTLAACSPTANISLESTGNGIGNHGYELYQEAKRGENAFAASFHPWPLAAEYRVPLNGLHADKIMGSLTKEERAFVDRFQKDHGVKIDAEQILFRRSKQKELRGLYRQEMPEQEEDAFLTSGHKFFEPRKIHRLLLEAKDYARENIPIEQCGGDALQWELPTKGHIYAAGADTSEGSVDYSVLKIICVTCRREAFRYRARCGVDHFYKVCDEWGRAYNDALLAVERNNHGHAVLLGLDESCHYPNLYREEKWNRAVNVRTPGSSGTEPTRTVKLGWQTDRVSKVTMLDDLKFAIEGDSAEDEEHFSPEIVWLDQTLLQEALTFEEVNGSLGAVEGKHDDDVIASAIAFQMYKRLRRYAQPLEPSLARSFGVVCGARRESIFVPSVTADAW